MVSSSTYSYCRRISLLKSALRNHHTLAASAPNTFNSAEPDAKDSPAPAESGVKDTTAPADRAEQEYNEWQLSDDEWNDIAWDPLSVSLNDALTLISVQCCR